ncbi:MAG: DUF4126 domain-containing protein [Verrucomicrobiota bacterium]
METLLSLCIGIGLSAACGFRIFVPLTIVSLAARTGHLTLAPGFDWMSSDAALIAFGSATVLEIAAYYVPWLDNLLDSIATPSAVVAGTILTASLVSNVDPFLKWTLAVIAGGAAAGLVQATTVVARGISTATTGGLANPVLATAELGGSLATSALAIFVPIAAVFLVVGVVGFLGYRAFSRRNPAPPVIPGNVA